VATIEGRNIKPVLIGDAGYKYEEYMVVPYPGRNLSADQTRFNKWHSSTRMCVEMVYVRNPADYTPIITTACILHNIMMDQNDVYDVERVDGVYLRRSQSVLVGQPSIPGREVRDISCQHMVKMNR
jgi:hypothetical protein